MKLKVWYIFGNPLKIKFKKHYCLTCGNNLAVKKHFKIVNSESLEAKYYDFTLGETNIRGNVEFVHNIFYCCNCNMEIEFVTQLSYEDHYRLINKLLKKYKIDISSIKKIWINEKGEEVTNIENINESFILKTVVQYNQIEIVVLDSKIKRKKLWERPYYIEINKKELKHNIKNIISTF